MDNEKTTLEKFEHKYKNNLIGAAIIVIVVVIIAAGNLTEAFNNIGNFFSKFEEPEFDPSGFQFGKYYISYEGGNGLSQNTAIIINGVFNTDIGIRAEKLWIEHFYPNYEIDSQALVSEDESSRIYYDLFVLKSTETGLTRELYFDISGFYGTPVSDPEIDRQMQRLAADIFSENGPNTATAENDK